MSFRSDGYAVFSNGLTAVALREMLALSYRHEAPSRPGDGRTWGEGKVNAGATFCFSLPQRSAKETS